MTQTATSRYAHMSKEQLVEIIETQQKVIAELRWHDENIGNAHLPIAARFAARAVRKFTQTREPCDDGYYKAYLPAMADLAGVSASTISRGLETLSDATEALDKYTDELRDEGGRKEKSVLYFRKNDTFEVATDIIPTKDVPKHGGNRRLPCPDCGCVHRRVKRREECAACGHQFFENERIIRGDEEPLQDATVAESEEQADDLQPFQDATVETPAAESGESLQLATLPVDTLVSCCNALPDDLKALPIWCCHRAKVPYNAKPARDPQKAKSNDSSTWTTYEQAKATYEASKQWKNPYDGIGFMCTGEFTVVDYDHCIENGKIDELVLSCIQEIDSYAEVSPSGTGIHQIARGTLPRNIKQPGCEMYDHLRFVTFTGEHLAMTPETIENRQEQLLALHTEIAPAPAEPREVQQKRDVYTHPGTCSDEEVLSKARGAANSAKFVKLWEGDASDYRKKDGSPDWSRADLALCRMLAYYSDGDENAIDRLFKQSKLYREKWERDDYRKGTISKALGGQIAS